MSLREKCFGSLLRAAMFGSALLVLSSALFADPNMEKKVRVYGSFVPASGILKQVEEQTGIVFKCSEPDTYKHKGHYDHDVRIQEVVDSFIAYYRDFNHVELKLVPVGDKAYVLIPSYQDAPEKFAAPEPLKVEVLTGSRFSSGRLNGDVGEFEDLSVKTAPAPVVESESVLEGRYKGLESKETKTLEESKASQDKKHWWEKAKKINPLKELRKPLKSLKNLFSKDEALEKKEVAAPALEKASEEQKPESKLTGMKEVNEIQSVQSLPESAILESAILESAILESAPEVESESVEKKESWLDKKYTKLTKSLSPAVEADQYHSFRQVGVLSGFMSAPVVPEKVLGEGQYQWGLNFEMATEEGSAPLRSSLSGKYSGSLMTTNFSGRMGTKQGVDIHADLHLAGHTGDFQVVGISGGSLGFVPADLELGLSGSLYRHAQGSVSGRVQLKLPLGSAGDMVSSGSMDGGVYVAHASNYYGFHQLVQLGYTQYGDHKAYASLAKSEGAFSGLAGVSLDGILPEGLLSAAFSYSQSPLESGSLPSYASDDQLAFQLGLTGLVGNVSTGGWLEFGLSDSVPDIAAAFGIQLSF